MSKLWDELVNTVIEMDDQLGELNIPQSMGHSRVVAIDGKEYTIKIIVEESWGD